MEELNHEKQQLNEIEQHIEKMKENTIFLTNEFEKRQEEMERIKKDQDSISIRIGFLEQINKLNKLLCEANNENEQYDINEQLQKVYTNMCNYKRINSKC